MSGSDKRFAHCVILCASIHDVTAAERRLHDAGLWCDMVPTPRALSSNCGMVLEFHGRDLERVRTLVAESSLRCLGIYTCSGTVYEREP